MNSAYLRYGVLEGKKRMYLVDYHIHTNRSMDGRDALDEVCMAAVKNGIKEIAVTDHFEPIKKDPEYKEYDGKACFSDILKARKKFEGLLTIKFGVELGHPHLYPKQSEKIISQYPYDFVLASGHKMPGDMDFSQVDYTDSSLDKFFRLYLSNLKELVLWGKYDCIGHFDLIKRYAALQGVSIDLMLCFPEEVIEILKIIIELGKGIEINTSGLRQKSGACLPDYDIVKKYKDLGGTIITVGSDAHKASYVGEGILEGIQLAEAAGFKCLAVYDKRKPYYIPIEKIKRKNTKETA